MKRPWVGNVRKMENVIIQEILFSTADEITPRDVDFDTVQPEEPHKEQSFQQLSYKKAKENTLQRFNFDYIGSPLAASNGNVTQAARLCELERQALQQIMRRYGIKADLFRKKTITFSEETRISTNLIKLPNIER